LRVADVLRIAFVALGFPPAVGGTELYNVEYARRLHAREHALSVFAFGATGDAARVEREAVAKLPFPVRRQPGSERGGFLDPGGLAAWLAEVRPEVVLLARASRRMGRVAAVAAHAAPTVVTVHELAGKHTERGPLGRWRVRRRYGLDVATRILASSTDTAHRVAALRVSVPIDIVYPGVDTAAFAPDAEARRVAREKLGLADRRVLLTVSRLAANKGHARVIEVLSRLRERFPDLVYVIVGEGGERAVLEARAAELDVADVVRFEGRVADTRAYYAACDVFAMPSGRPSAAGKAGEGFGISYVEAGSQGVPVVASGSGGGTDIVIDGETGRLVDPGDANALESAIAGLLADPADARRMGDAARRHCAHFDWERGADALESSLRAAIQGSP
jgi:phosphatidylinositol alpha-1,6-mannosyltransferase